MADKTLEILLKIMADDKGAKVIVKSFDDVEKQANKSATGLDKVKKSGLSLNSAFKQIVAGGALLAIGKGLLDFAKNSVALASDVEETASKFKFVFGPAADETSEALENFAEAAGRSRFQLMETAAGFGGMLEGMLGSKEAAAGMSVEMSKLTTDLASFYNVAEQDVATALQSGLVGETEPMRRFGVVMNAAAVEAEVLAMGLAENKKEITEAMKVQARYNLILQGTATAQGDAERTSDSYANQQRALQAALEELSVTLGQELIPLALELTKTMIEMVDRMQPSVDALTGTYGDMTQQIVNDNIEAAQSMEDLIAQGQRIQEVNKIWGGLGTVITGTSDDLEQSQMDLAYAIARTSKSSDELASSLTAAMGGGIFERGGEEFYQISSGLGYIQIAMSDLADVMGKEIPPNSELFAYNTYKAAQAQEELIKVTDDSMPSLAAYEQVLRTAEQAQRDQAAAAEAAALKEAAAAEIRKEFTNAFTAALDNQEAAFGRWVTTGTKVGGLSEDQQTNFEDLSRKADSLRANINSLNGGTASLGLTQEQINEKLADNYEQLGLVEGAIANLGDTTVTYTDVQSKWVADAEAMNEQLFQQITANTDNEIAIAAAGLALGLYDEAQVEAALNAAIINEKINQLAATFVAGDIAAGDLKMQMDAIVANSPYTTEIEARTDKAKASVDAYKRALDKIPREIVTKVRVDGGASGVPKDASATGGNGDTGGRGYATGTGGQWLTVPPGYPNDSYNIGLQSGEQFAVIPAGGNAQGMGQATIYIDARGSSPSETQKAVERALAMSGRQADARMRT